MKTVATSADLKRLALSQGAVVSVGGRTINSQGAKMHVIAPRAPEPAPAPAPAPTEQAALPPPDIEAVIERMGDKIAFAMASMQTPRQEPAVAAPAPRRAPIKRVFSVQVDKQGLITRVVGEAPGVEPLSFRVNRRDDLTAFEIIQE